MKGITFIKDETSNKRFVQIDLDTLEKYSDTLEELFDVIIAESRKSDEVISIEKLESELREEGKL